MNVDIELKEIVSLTEKQVIHTLATKNHISLSEARRMFCSSKTRAALRIFSTGLWKESVPYIIYEFEQEFL